MMLAELASLANSNPGVSAFAGSLVGVIVASIPAVKRRWRKEARGEALKVGRQLVADHAAACAWRPNLTPVPFNTNPRT
jgi:hypothetical protein